MLLKRTRSTPYIGAGSVWFSFLQKLPSFSSAFSVQNSTAILRCIRRLILLLVLMLLLMVNVIHDQVGSAIDDQIYFVFPSFAIRPLS